MSHQKHAKSMAHHAKAGDALKAGDTKTAMHHLGHIMADCRQCLRDEAKGVTVTKATHAEHADAPKAPKSSLRDRLKGMKKY